MTAVLAAAVGPTGRVTAVDVIQPESQEVVVTAGTLLAYGQTRFRVPAEPTIVVLAAVSLAALTNRWWPERGTPEPEPEPRDEPTDQVVESSTIVASSSS